jgi:CRISPR-associated protein Cst1
VSTEDGHVACDSGRSDVDDLRQLGMDDMMTQMRHQDAESRGGSSAGLWWTGHALVDHGIATLTAFASLQRGGVARPSDVTTEDLEQFAQFAERALKTETVRSHASVLFTINVPYLQPSHPPERRVANARWLLRVQEPSETPDEGACSYCGRPAVSVRAVVKSDRLYRELVPMLTGQGIVNFAPGGDHGLPMCGHCIVALHALILGAPSCEGRALVVQADDPTFLVELVRGWLPEIQRRVQLSEATNRKVDTWKAPRTRLIDRLVRLEQKSDEGAGSTGLTIYHLSNSGQGPGLGIFLLSARVVRFVRLAQLPQYRTAWHRLEQRAWRDAKYKDADRDPTTDERPYWRNTFYEQLFDLPAGAGRFVRTRLISTQFAALDNRSRADHVPMWELTTLFLKEVMGVEHAKISAIRDLGDAIADEIVTNNDRRLFRSAYQATRYPHLRRLLLQASSRRMLRGAAPLVTLETFLMIFEDAEELARPDWRLAWDLVLIRLVDRLFEQGWVREHADALTDVAESLASTDDENELLAGEG